MEETYDSCIMKVSAASHMLRIRIGLICFVLFAGLFVQSTGWATEVHLVGSMGSRAVLQINGGAPRAVEVGTRTSEGVKLVALNGDQAVVEIDGRRVHVRLGEGAIRSAPANEVAKVVLHADMQGHFSSQGRINGASVRFLVDTGATLVSIGLADAQRAGINFRSGVPVTLQTAAAQVQAWQVTLDTVQIGGAVLHNVDAVVIEQQLPFALLGMSALKRMEMRREGSTLILQKRY